MSGLALHTVSGSFQHEQIESLTAETKHAIALALRVGFVIGGSLARLLFALVKIEFFRHVVLVRYT